MLRSLNIVLFLVAGCFVTGCGTKSSGLKVEYVEGIVTLDGKVVEGASVTFISQGAGESAGGVSGPDGSYLLTSENGDIDKGALAGNYKVTVKKVESKNYMNPDGTYAPDAPKDLATGGKLGSVQTNLLPKQYSMISSTPLNFTVAPGKNKIDLELKN